jgi:hypothetical protein
MVYMEIRINYHGLPFLTERTILDTFEKDNLTIVAVKIYQEIDV